MKKTMQLDFTNQIAHIEIAEVDNFHVIVKTWGRDFGWSEADARYVMELHQRYILNLNAAGIKTSHTLEEVVIKNHTNNEHVIQSTEKFFDQGDMLTSLMKSQDTQEFLDHLSRQVTLLANMLFVIPPLRKEIYSVDWMWLSVALDLKPQNTVLVSDEKGENQAVLIDTFRPQIWDTDTIELLPLPSINPSKRKILYDEIKTGDLRFQSGRLWGYYVAIATRWLINSDSHCDVRTIDAWRAEVACCILRIVKQTLFKKTKIGDELKETLITDIREIVDESITVGMYEGPRYVQSVYEAEIS